MPLGVGRTGLAPGGVAVLEAFFSDGGLRGSLGLGGLLGLGSRVLASEVSAGLDDSLWASDFGDAGPREQAGISRHADASHAILTTHFKRAARTNTCDGSFIEADYG